MNAVAEATIAIDVAIDWAGGSVVEARPTARSVQIARTERHRFHQSTSSIALRRRLRPDTSAWAQPSTAWIVALGHGSRLVGSGSHELAGYTTTMYTQTEITRIEVDESADTTSVLAYGLGVVRRWSRRYCRLPLRDLTIDLLHLPHVGRRVSLPATDC